MHFVFAVTNYRHKYICHMISILGVKSLSKKARDTVAWVLVCIMAMLVPGVMGAAAGSTSTVYQKSYSIENLLSDYQYFTQSNLTAMSHTVGAIACGGNAEIENFGDGATAVSYFNHIVSIGNYNAGNYFENLPEYKGYIGLPAYYKTAGDGVSAGSNIKQYTGSGEYIDFSKAFENIASESEGLMEDAYTVTDGDIAGDIYNGFTLTLPFEKSKNIIIPKEIYDKVNYIKLGITDISDISKNRYTVSFTGFINTDISLTFQYIGFSKDNKTKGILSTNGQSFNNDNSLKNKLTDGSIQAGQMNMSGMKLIWNFPDAKSIKSEYTGGHIVAPKAEVTVKDGSGNFEGGIIAKSITNNSAEGHFYPYSAVKSSGSSSSEQPSSSPSTVGGSSSSEQPSSSPSTGGSSSSSEQPSSSPSTGGSSSSSKQSSSSPSTGGGSSSSKQSSSSPSTGGGSSSSKQSSSSPSTGGGSSSSKQSSSSPSTDSGSSSNNQPSGTVSTGGGSPSGNFSLNKTATATAVKNQYAKLPKTGSPIDASVLLAAAALSILTGSVVTWKKRR